MCAMSRNVNPTLLALVVLIGSVHAKEISVAIQENVTAANAFLNALDTHQREMVWYAFDDAERENWHYIPKERRGLPIKNMSDEQQEAAFNLVRTILSAEGVSKTRDLMYLEGYLADKEGSPDYRDVGKYYFTLFGKPEPHGSWGWQLEGHHLSVNAVFVDGARISVTPSFMGANPAEVRDGTREGLRTLAQEEDVARELAVMLQRSGYSNVLFSAEPPREILSRAERKAELLDRVGIAAADMPIDVQDVLKNLIQIYAGRYRAEFAAADLKQIEEAGFRNIHFGWAGGLEHGDTFYYRVQGPTFLLEAANVQNKGNHIHTVWRDFNGDFGRDLLAEHLHTHAH